MEKSSDIPKPKSNHVRFYILTNKGRYTFETPESEATNEKSEWANLFYKGNEVITQLRLTTTNK